MGNHADAGVVSGPVGAANPGGEQFVPMGPVEVGMECAGLFLRGKPFGRKAVRHVTVAKGAGIAGVVVLVFTAAEA